MINKIRKDKYLLISFFIIAVFFYPSLYLGFYYADDRSAYTPWLYAELWSLSSYGEMLSDLSKWKFLEMYGTQNTFRIIGQLFQMAANNISLFFDIPIRVVGYIFNLISIIPLLIYFRVIINNDKVFMPVALFYFSTIPLLTHFYWLINIAYIPVILLPGLILLISRHVEIKGFQSKLSSITLLLLHLLFLLSSELALSMPLILMAFSIYFYKNTFKVAALRFSPLLVLNVIYVLFYLLLLSNSSTNESGVYNQTLGQIYGSSGQIITYIGRFFLTFFHLLLPINAVNSIVLLIGYMIGYLAYIFIVFKSGREAVKFVFISLFICSMPLFAIGVSRLYYLYFLIIPLSIPIIIYSGKVKIDHIRMVFISLLLLNLTNSIHWYSVYKNDTDMESTTLYHLLVKNIKLNYLGVVSDKDINYKFVNIVYGLKTLNMDVKIKDIEGMVSTSNYRVINHAEFVKLYKNKIIQDKLLSLRIYPFMKNIFLYDEILKKYVVIGGGDKANKTKFDILKKHNISRATSGRPILIDKQLIK